MPTHYRLTIVLAVFAKGVVMGVLATFIDAPFLKSLILIAVSAGMTGAFAVLVAWLQTRANSELHKRIDRMEDRQVSVAEQAGIDPQLPPLEKQE